MKTKQQTTTRWVELFVCWRCRPSDTIKRFSRNELVRREEDEDHIDFCCPKCESVIICSTRKKQS